MTKVKVKNRGQLTKYYYEDAHEAILDRDTYEKVKAEMARRTAMLNPTYCFSGRIVCGCCGMPYTRNKNKVRGKVYVRWICRSKKETGMTCISRNIKESELENISAGILGIGTFDGEAFTSLVRQMTVLPSGDIEFIMKDGKKEVGKMPPKP